MNSPILKTTISLEKAISLFSDEDNHKSQKEWAADLCRAIKFGLIPTTYMQIDETLHRHPMGFDVPFFKGERVVQATEDMLCSKNITLAVNREPYATNIFKLIRIEVSAIHSWIKHADIQNPPASLSTDSSTELAWHKQVISAAKLIIAREIKKNGEEPFLGEVAKEIHTNLKLYKIDNKRKKPPAESTINKIIQKKGLTKRMPNGRK